MTVARSGMLYLAGNLLSAGVPFLLMPLLTRILEPAEYGAVVNFFVLIVCCTPLAGFTVHGALGVAWFQKAPDQLPAYVGNAIVLAAASSVLVAIAIWIALSLMSGLNLGFPPAIGALAALFAGANVILQCRLVLWQSQNLATANIALQIASSVLNMLLSLAGVLLLRWGADGRIIGAVVSAMLIAIVAVVLLRRSGLARFAVRKDDSRELLNFGGSLIPHGLAGALLTNADRFVIAVLLGTAALGTYGAAAQLGSVMTIATDAFVKAFCPWLFARLQKNDADSNLQAVGAMYAVVPAFLLLGVFAWAGLYVLGHVLLGPQYRSALVLLPWFVLGGSFSGVYSATAGLFFYGARTASLSAISFPISILGIGITVLLVRAIGSTGAAVGYALLQFLLAGAGWLAARRMFALPFDRPGDALRAWWQTLPRGVSPR